MGWDKVTQPKKHGGLGIRPAREANTAMLGRLVWDMQCKKDKLWVQMLMKQYSIDVNFPHTTPWHESRGWNAIFKAKEELKGGYQFRVGNGESLFWYSPWTTIGPLCQHVFAVNI